MFSNDEQPRGCAVVDECLLNCQQSVNSNEEVAVVCVLKSVYIYIFSVAPLSAFANRKRTHNILRRFRHIHSPSTQLATPHSTIYALSKSFRGFRDCCDARDPIMRITIMVVWWCEWYVMEGEVVSHEVCVCLRSEQPAFPIHMALVNECDLARAKTITRQIWYVNGFSPHKSITYPYRYAFNSAVASYNLRLRNACSIIDPSYFVSPYNTYNKRGFIAIHIRRSTKYFSMMFRHFSIYISLWKRSTCDLLTIYWPVNASSSFSSFDVRWWFGRGHPKSVYGWDGVWTRWWSSEHQWRND